MQTGGQEAKEQLWRKIPGDLSSWQVEYESSVPWQPGGPLVSWDSLGKGGACPALLCFEPHSLRTGNYCFVHLGEEKAVGKRGSRVEDADVSDDQWKDRRDGNEIVSGGNQIGHTV